MSYKITHNKRESGYVALLSTIIIGAVLLVMTIELGQSGWYTRFMVLGSEAKEQSRTLATGCSNQALGMVMANMKWAGNSTTTDTESGTCYVFPVQKNFPTPDTMTLRVQSNVSGAVTNLVLVYDMGEIHQAGAPLPHTVSPPATPTVVPVLLSWQEVVVMP
jgi:hypothetical protein